MSAITNLWNLLNLESSPFFQDRLSPGGDAAHPIGLFVGRTTEAELLLRAIRGSESTRLAIPGGVGRGKTTLAQFVKSELVRSGYLAAEEPVSVGSADGAAELLARILSTVYQTVLANGGARLADEEPMRVARQLLRAFQIHGGSLSLGITGLGSVGGGISTSYITGPAALSVLAPDLLRRIAALAREELHAAGVVVHLNNLENLSEADAQRAARVLRDLRDTALLVPGLHHLLVGTDDAVRTIVQAQPQLRSVFHVLPTLPPLTDSEMLELLRRRYQHLRRDPAAPVHPPATDAAVLEIYTLFRGDLRGTLGALEEAAVRLVGLAGESATDPMDRDAVRSALRGVYLEQIEAAVSPGDSELLASLAHHFGERSFTQAEALEETRIPLATLSDAFARLLTLGFLLVIGKRAASGPGRRPSEHALSGAVRLAFG